MLFEVHAGMLNGKNLQPYASRQRSDSHGFQSVVRRWSGTKSASESGDGRKGHEQRQWPALHRARTNKWHSTTSCLPLSLTLESSGAPQIGMARLLSAAVAHNAPNIDKRKMQLSAEQCSGSKPSSSARQSFSPNSSSTMVPHRSRHDIPTSIVEILQMAAFRCREAATCGVWTHPGDQRHRPSAEGHRSPPPRTTPAEPLWPSNLNQQLWICENVWKCEGPGSSTQLILL